MKIEVTDNVNCGLEKVFTMFRDHITDLVSYLPDVDDIKVIEKETVDENNVKMVNRWFANYETVPSVARAFVKPDMLQWVDFATWSQDDWTCNWIIEVNSFKEAVSCKGTTKYLSLDENITKVIIRGDLQIDVKKIPKVPKIGAGRIGKLVENFMAPVISSNLTNVHRGLESYLKDNK